MFKILHIPSAKYVSGYMRNAALLFKTRLGAEQYLVRHTYYSYNLQNRLILWYCSNSYRLKINDHEFEIVEV